MIKTVEISTQGIPKVMVDRVILSYQLFGRRLGSAPVVLVNHALTGNSNVAGEKGWWKVLIGSGRTIDPDRYTIIAFNLPGNGFTEEQTDSNGGKPFTLEQVADLLLRGLETLGIDRLYAIIGGSLGGGLAWELWAKSPRLARFIIPIAAHWQSSSWVNGFCAVQREAIQAQGGDLKLARKLSMFFYRNSDNFLDKFGDEANLEAAYQSSESWLEYHSEALKGRLSVPAYTNMLNLLGGINALRDPKRFAEALRQTTSTFHLISFSSDILFPGDVTLNSVDLLSRNGVDVFYEEIESRNGHDAFLIEFKKLDRALSSIFKLEQTIHSLNPTP